MRRMISSMSKLLGVVAALVLTVGAHAQSTDPAPGPELYEITTIAISGDTLGGATPFVFFGNHGPSISANGTLAFLAEDATGFAAVFVRDQSGTHVVVDNGAGDEFSSEVDINNSGEDHDAMATFVLYLHDQEAESGLEKLRVLDGSG
jgi:hypothetical protein